MSDHSKDQNREVSLSSFCLSIARLYLRDKTNLSGEMMAELTSRLIKAEIAPGGPYIGPSGSPDLPTNIAVGYLFACFNKPLPRVGNFIAEARTMQSTSPTLKQLLRLYDKATTPSPKKPSPPIDHQKIFLTTKQNLKSLRQPEKTLALAFLSKIHQADQSYEIALLPTFLAHSLSPLLPALPLARLGEANILCWMAYSIYDKLLDDEPAAQYLPIANITQRKSIEIYQSLLPSSHPFHQTILDTFLAMDHANAWEMTFCRFKRAGESISISGLPHYGQNMLLAKRSLGHILGPLTIAALLDLPASNVKNLEKGLCHYLIARQLSDDIHDWKEDFEAGHASNVVTYILKHLKIQPGTYKVELLLERMQHDFWDHSMEATNTQIHRHLRLSRRYLLKGGLRKDGKIFTLLDRLTSSAAESANQQKQYRSFLSSYLKVNDFRPSPQ